MGKRVRFIMLIGFLAASHSCHSWPIPAFGPPTAEGEAEQFEMSNSHSWRIESPGGTQGEVGGHPKNGWKIPEKNGLKGRVKSPLIDAGFYFLGGGCRLTSHKQ